MINNNENYIVNSNYYKIINYFKIDTIIDNGYSNIENILNSMNNKNKCLLIVESMCIGLFLSDYIALKFGYIRNLMEYDKCETYKKYKIKIFRITSSWDTSKWSYLKLCNFHVNLEYYEQNTIQQIKDNIKDNKWRRQYIDVDFLEALCWDPPDLKINDTI